MDKFPMEQNQSLETSLCIHDAMATTELKMALSQKRTDHTIIGAKANGYPHGKT